MGCDIWGKWVWVREETELDLRKVAALGDTVEELSAPHQLHEEIYARVVLDHVVAAHDEWVAHLGEGERERGRAGGFFIAGFGGGGGG